MRNKPNLFVTLTITYLALLTVCIAIYAILQLYVKEVDRGTATNLMIWSATLFPSIALLYTFNSWGHQKGTEVIANEAKEAIKNINLYTTAILESTFHPYLKSNNKELDIKMNIYINIFSNSIIFIWKSNNDEELKNQYDCFNEYLSQFLDKIYDSSGEETDNLILKLELFQKIFNSKEEIIKILFKYALYKK